MNAKMRKIYVIVVMALAAVWLTILWLQASLDGSANQLALTFTCDGSAVEQGYLAEESGTEIKDGVRCFLSETSQVRYRLATGKARLERFWVSVNSVPWRLDFSADGRHWDTLLSIGGIGGRPNQFSTQSSGFSPKQCEATVSSGTAWFRIQPARTEQSDPLRLQSFRLSVTGENVPASFQRSTLWHKLASFAPGRLMVLVGAIALLFVWRRWRMPWWLWGGGALLWVMAVAMKAGVALIANAPVNQALHAGLPKNLADPLFWLYVGLLTGVFECGIFLAVTPLFRRKAWSWREAVSLGVGFGAMEAVALGAGTIFAVSRTGIWASAPTDVGTVSAAFERVLALIVHVAATVMIIRSLTTRRWGWFVASFGYKSAVDAVAAWLLFSNSSLRSHPWLMELSCFGPFALVGLFALWCLKEQYRQKRVAH